MHYIPLGALYSTLENSRISYIKYSRDTKAMPKAARARCDFHDPNKGPRGEDRRNSQKQIKLLQNIQIYAKDMVKK